jgi:hypothetical protein
MKRAAAILAVLVATRTANAEPPKIEDPAGTEVNIASRSPDTMIYLQKGEVASSSFEDPFVRLGIAPRKLRLAPGAYTIESDGPTQSLGRTSFWVEQNTPLDVQVRPGDASLKSFGAALSVLGVTAILTGIIAIVSISPDDSNYDRWAIGLPLAIGGAACIGAGIGLSVAGATRIEVTKR